MFLALTSDVLPLPELDEYAQTNLAQRLSTVQGVAQVQVFGSQKYAVRIQLDPQALSARGVGIDQVSEAISSGNVNLPTGVLWGPDKAVTLRSEGQLESAAEFRDLVIKAQDGALVRLGDLGLVKDGVQESRVASWFNGRRSIVLAINRQPARTPCAWRMPCTRWSRRSGRSCQARFASRRSMTAPSRSGTR